MNPTAIYSKSGKGVQEASGKTSNLSRADRAVLSSIDGKATVADIAQKLGRDFDDKFIEVVSAMESGGFVRAVSAGTPVAAPAPSRPAGRAAAPPPPADDSGEELDFTAMPKSPPKAAAPSKAPVDLAARARAGNDQRARDAAPDYKARQETEAKAKAEAQAKAASQAKAAAEAKAAEAKAVAEAALRAQSDAKV